MAGQHGRANDVAVEVAARSSKQVLLETIEAYIAVQAALQPPVARGAVAWPGLRHAIRLALLGPGDADMTRNQLATAQQAAHEDVVSYALSASQP